jgi:hypothetical protein
MGFPANPNGQDSAAFLVPSRRCFTSGLIGAKIRGMVAPARPVKITFAELPEQGVRGILIYCPDYRSSDSIATSGDRWPGDLRLCDIEDRFTCSECGKRDAGVRPYFDWGKRLVRAIGYRSS